MERPAKLPALDPIYVGDRCDPSRIVGAVHGDLATSLELSRRVFRHHGRTYVAARLLAPEDVDVLLDALDDPEIGLHIDQLGRFPGLDGWLAWSGLRRIRHLSFHAGFLGRAGLEALVATGNVTQVRSLDLASCDIGHQGLKLLKTTEAMPELEELYLGANTDYDKTKWNEKAVAALFKPTKAQPIGKSLDGLRVLSLEAWTLTDAIESLASSSVMRGLEHLDLSHVNELVHGRTASSVPKLLVALAGAGARLHTLSLAGEVPSAWGAPAEPLALRTLHARFVPLDRLARAWFWDSLEELSIEGAALQPSAAPLPPRLRRLAIRGTATGTGPGLAYTIPEALLARLADHPVVQMLESLTLEGYPFQLPAPDAAWPEVIRRALSPA
jgi:hypothetical protein